MQIDKLKALEAEFLEQIPGGFDNPEMAKIGKRHRLSKRVEEAQFAFSEAGLQNVNVAVDAWIKIVSRSSMVSLFEKPKFRDFVQALSADEKGLMIDGLTQLLHGNQRLGFDMIVNVLVMGKLAKWSLITTVPAFYAPNDEVFVKPTTAKMIAQHFGFDIAYKPRPSWDFYEQYRSFVNTYKQEVDPSLASSNAAFCGFLMMILKGK